MTGSTRLSSRRDELRPKRTLLDPNFEGYKLAFLHQDPRARVDHIADLPGTPLSLSELDRQWRPSDAKAHTSFSYAMAAARMAANNLLEVDLGGGERRLVYLDADWRVNLCFSNGQLDRAIPLVEPIATAQTRQHALFPSMIAARPVSSDSASSSHLLCSDGMGSLFIIDLSTRAVTDTFHQPDPFVLLDATVTNSDGMHCLNVILYTVSEDTLATDSASTTNSRPRARPATRFHGTQLVFELSTTTPMDVDDASPSIPVLHPTRLTHLWTSRAHPHFAALTPSGTVIAGSNALLARAAAAFAITDDESTPEWRPSSDPGAPTPATAPEPSPTSTVFQCAHFAYMWTQTATDMTVHITLATRVSPRQVQCRFTPTGVSLVVKGMQLSPSESPQTVVILDGAPWARIVPDDCVWTLEEQTHLVVHLEKAEARTRWTHILDTDDRCLETVDPSELAGMREALAKYTSQMDDAATALRGRAVPAGAQGGTTSFMQDHEDIDLEMDEPTLCVARITVNGSVSEVEPVATGLHQYLCPAWPRGVCFKHDVDGVVYLLDELEHVYSAPAFGYVQASKREKRLAVAASRFVVLAEARHHVYVYMMPATTMEHRATQYMVEIGDGEVAGLTPVCGDDGEAIGFAVATTKGLYMVHLPL
ncbi:NudC domain-containing protein 1 [Allomyces arbusculus]|nr:NudC domain-containing protein 1 [Allomyces arbusculus]